MEPLNGMPHWFPGRVVPPKGKPLKSPMTALLVPDFKGAALGPDLERHIHARSFEPMTQPPSQKRLPRMATGRY